MYINSHFLGLKVLTQKFSFFRIQYFTPKWPPKYVLLIFLKKKTLKNNTKIRTLADFARASQCGLYKSATYIMRYEIDLFWLFVYECTKCYLNRGIIYDDWFECSTKCCTNFSFSLHLAALDAKTYQVLIFSIWFCILYFSYIFVLYKFIYFIFINFPFSLSSSSVY